MLLMADYEDDDKNIFERSMGGYYKIYSENDGLIGQASLTAMVEPVGERVGGYARYWHGWLLALRFLLMFFSYDDIRFIGVIFQYALMIYLFLLMQKRQISDHAIGLFAALMIICPIASCISMEYTFIFYISMIANIFILHFHEKFYQNKLYPYIFCYRDINELF